MKESGISEHLLQKCVTNLYKNPNAISDNLSNTNSEISYPSKGSNIDFYFARPIYILISINHCFILVSVNELSLLTSYGQSIDLFVSLVYFGNIITSTIF